MIRSQQTLWRRAWRESCRALLDLVCPPTCPACGAASDGLCGSCGERLSVCRRPWCRRCGEPILSEEDRCRHDHRHLAGITMGRAPFRYVGAAGDIVRRAKFQQDRVALHYLACRMSACLDRQLPGPCKRRLVVSVPLYPAKRRRRGHDQAAILAESVAHRLGLRFLTRGLGRVRDTLPQGDVRVTSRERNVAGAFCVRRPGPVRGATVVLVDDVVTSGSTARECARVLRAAGAVQIVLLTAARARPPTVA